MSVSKDIPMKPTHALQTIATTPVANTGTVARFQIYQQTREGIYTAAFKTDSAVEAVGAFLRQSPAFEGGEVRFWDNREQHVRAWVKWTSEIPGVGVSQFGRENVFQDRLLAVIARHVESREEMREDVRQGVRAKV
jgi:hypothetical protein